MYAYLIETPERGAAPAMTESNSRYAKELDATGLLCPMPVLRTRRILDDMTAGELLLVKASDPASVQDMPAFCKMSGNRLQMAHVKNGIFLFEIEKGRVRPSDEAEAEPIRRTPK